MEKRLWSFPGVYFLKKREKKFESSPVLVVVLVLKSKGPTIELLRGRMRGGGGGDFEKKEFLQALVGRKKIACSTNVI